MVRLSRVEPSKVSGPFVEVWKALAQIDATDGTDESDDGSAAEAGAPATQWAEFEFHITWNAAYRVPVLFFLARDADGTPLPPSVVRAALDLGTGESGDEHNHWTMMTQEEHPHTRALAYSLHPCETAPRMASMLEVTAHNRGGHDTGSTYLLAWFAMVAPVLRLRLRPGAFAELARLAVMVGHSDVSGSDFDCCCSTYV